MDREQLARGFGQFVGELLCGWIRARQATGADPAETADRLLAWMGDDPYGFASDLDSGAAKVLDKAGFAGLKRDLLTKLGRGNEALEAAWADYSEHPGKYSYRQKPRRRGALDCIAASGRRSSPSTARWTAERWRRGQDHGKPHRRPPPATPATAAT